ncbi:MAG: T9SS type A sorting domain-containing protein [Bacteroidia bacterium]
MKKKLLSLFITATLCGYSQTPSLQWQKNVNGQLSGYENTVGSWKDPNGNFLITGTSNNDAFVLKVDNNGNELLRIIWDGPQSGYDVGNSVRSDAAGNIYVGGVTENGAYRVPFVVKFNSGGVKQWQYVQTYATIAGDLTGMVLDNYNSPANIYFTGNKNDSSAIIKLNTATGTSVWEKTLWPHGKMNDIDIDNNGHPLVCGYQAFSGINANFYAAVLDVNSGYPLRGYWRDGAALDSVTDQYSHFDMATKIKAGPAGSFVVFGTIYNSANAGTILMAKFGSTGGIPIWEYTYDSPAHIGGNGVQLLTDASFTNFYYLAAANSTSGSYYTYTIAGKVNNSGTAVWEKEFNLPGQSLVAHDMALDANGNAHIISDAGSPGDIYYKKLASATGLASSTLQYDNQRGGGNAYDYSSNIFLDNTGHPYIIGSSNALTYTNVDVLLCRLNTNATLDWDVTFDFFVSSQNTAFNVQTMPTNGSGVEQIVTCGRVINNLTGSDVSITSYSESGAVNWQEIFDDNNGGDQVIGFEKSYSNNLFLCSYNSINNASTVTEFYSNGTTNFSNQPNWPFQPNCFKIDSAENSFVGGSISGASDFYFGIYLRSGSPLNNTPAVAANIQTSAYSIATDNINAYVAGTISDFNVGVSDGQHLYIQKFDLAATKLWSVKIRGFDSTSFSSYPVKIVYDRASNALYLTGTAVSVGSSVVQTLLAKINVNGTVAWVRKENASNTRYQYVNDLVVKNNKIYTSGYAYNISSPGDNFMLTEEWDINGNKQWEYVFDKPTTDEQGTSLAVDNAGNVFAGGRTNGLSNTNSDMLLVKLNTTGNLVWKKEFNGTSNGLDYAASIALSNANTTNPRIYMCGNTQSTGAGNYDIATLKYCDLPATHVAYSGNTNICQNSSLNLNASGTSSGSIVWMPGAVASSVINVATSGNYYFTYTEADGCAENSDSVQVSIKGAPATVQICMVTVDSLSTHNIIYWDKTGVTSDVVGFKVYREDLTNVYTYIGAVSMDSLSEFHDYGVNPNVTTKRYKISAIDSCGNESVKSNYHNTIYIVNAGNGQYIWNPVYTIENTANPVSSYVLLRDDNNTGNFQQIASTAGTSNTLNDVNYASYPNGNWRVDALGFNCNPTQRLVGGNNSTMAAKIKSHSNQANNRASGINNVTDFVNQVAVYPNPGNGAITVSSFEKMDAFKVTDMLGNTIYDIKPANQKVNLTIENSGVYFITILSGNQSIIKKVVVAN